MKHFFAFVFGSALALALSACSAKSDGMVVAANPLASQAGIDVLKSGGSAIDAAIAVQAVLGLVEPQSSGLGGGAFMLVYRPKCFSTQKQASRFDILMGSPLGAQQAYPALS